MAAFGVLEYNSKNLFEKFYLNPENSDVTLCVGSKKIPAHKFILGVESEYFRNLLQGGFKEALEKEVVIDAPEEAFTLYLKYLYCGTIDLRAEKMEAVLELLGLAHKLLSSKLKNDISKYLQNILKADDVLEVLMYAKLFDLPELESKCFEEIDWKAEQVLFQEDFLDSSLDLFLEIFSRKTKNISEKRAFEAALKWIGCHSEVVKENKGCLGKIMSCVDLSCLPYQQIKEATSSLQFFDDSFISGLLAKNLRAPKVIKRAAALGPKNIVIPEKGFQVLSGINPLNLTLDGENYTQSSNQFGYVLVDLGHEFTFNNVEFKMQQAACYQVLVSKDRSSYKTVVDFNRFKCFGLQKLFFDPVEARFIKVVAPGLAINSFKVFMEEKTPVMKENVMIPTKNVINEYHVALSPKLPGGGDSEKLSVLSFFEDRGMNTPFYVHTGESHIGFVFHQPYWLSSCRLRLWDFDGRKQSCEVDIVNGDKVETVYKSRGLERDWIEVSFSERVVTAIWVTGTGSTIGDEFKLAYFEAPSYWENCCMLDQLKALYIK